MTPEDTVAFAHLAGRLMRQAARADARGGPVPLGSAMVWLLHGTGADDARDAALFARLRSWRWISSACVPGTAGWRNRAELACRPIVAYSCHGKPQALAGGGQLPVKALMR